MRASTSIAAIVAKTLELQQGKIQWVASPRSDFPNLDPVSAYVMTPGLCLAFRGTSGDILQRFCSGAPIPANPPPQVFTAFYRSLFDPGREAARPVIVRGTKLGEAVVSVEPAVQTAEAWHEAGRLMLALAIALPLLCVLVYAALARALRPTRMIRTGLERIAANDLPRGCRRSISPSSPRSATSSTISPKASTPRWPSAAS